MAAKPGYIYIVQFHFDSINSTDVYGIGITTNPIDILDQYEKRYDNELYLIDLISVKDVLIPLKQALDKMVVECEYDVYPLILKSDRGEEFYQAELNVLYDIIEQVTMVQV